jgi:hypothetical protein
MENKNIYDYNFNMLSALKKNPTNYSTYIYVFAVHICICWGRAFVCPVIFMGGLLSAQ